MCGHSQTGVVLTTYVFTFKRCGHYNTCVVLTTHKVFIPSVWVLPHMCAQYHAPRVQSEIRRSPGFFHGSLEMSIPPGKNMSISFVYPLGYSMAPWKFPYPLEITMTLWFLLPPGIFHVSLEIST